MPNVASSVVWKWLFRPGYGIVNWMLTKLHIFGNMLNVAWSNNTTLAFLCIWMLVIWQAVPYIAITLYAATTQLDQSCLEAAQIDGAGHIREWQILRKITFPLVAPGVVSTSVFAFITAWNDYLTAYTFMRDQAKYTLPVWLSSFTTPAGTDFGGQMAASVLFSLPVVVFFMIVQRNIAKGSTAGAVK